MNDVLREKILELDDRGLEEVEVPEWPGTEGELFLRRLTHKEAMEYLRELEPLKGVGAMGPTMVGLVRRCLCDRTGALIFDEDSAQELLESRANAAVKRLFKESQRVNGLGENADKEVSGN